MPSTARAVPGKRSGTSSTFVRRIPNPIGFWGRQGDQEALREKSAPLSSRLATIENSPAIYPWDRLASDTKSVKRAAETVRNPER